MTPKRTLMLILAFVALTFGSFIWFIATWDRSKEESISYLHCWENTAGSGAAPQSAACKGARG